MAETITVVELAPNQRYRLWKGKRSDRIEELVQVKRGAERTVAYVDDLEKPTISAQYGEDFVVPGAIIGAGLRSRPTPRKPSITHMAIALQGAGLLLGTDESLKGEDEDAVKTAQHQRMIAASQKMAVFEASDQVAGNARWDKLSWILFGAVTLTLLAMAIFLLPSIMSLMEGLSFSVPLIGGGGEPTPATTPTPTPEVNG